jgi:GMP synthase-like glutamine amidotransferase
MNVHVLQHIPVEGIGSIESWLQSRKAKVSRTLFFEEPVLPKPDGMDFVIVMGGTMSVNEEDRLPWLAAEKEWLRQILKKDIPVLGVCLGAQLIASALGAKVHPNSLQEIGWFPVEGVSTTNGAFRFPDRFGSFHWHGETFDLPDGADRIAQTEACRNQAFQIGRRIIGLQFHLEFTKGLLSGLINDFGRHIKPGPYVQSPAELLDMPEEHFRNANRLLDDVLDYLTRP